MDVLDVKLIMFVVDVVFIMLIVFLMFVSVVFIALRMRARWCRVHVGWRCHPYPDTFSIELWGAKRWAEGERGEHAKGKCSAVHVGGERRPS